MAGLRLWMRGVGAFYLLLFVMAVFVKLPLQIFLENAAEIPVTDPVYMFLVDTWVMFGLDLGVIGVMLLVASRDPLRHRILVWTVIALELIRGIADDIYMINRGYAVEGLIVWIVLHSIVIGLGLLALRRSASADGPGSPLLTSPG